MIKISVDDKKSTNISFLQPKEVLHREFWDEKVLLPEISEALMKIADSILDSMDIEADVTDITITGSMASYNYHDMSDIDLHILFNFREIDENYELVKRMLDQSRINWNKAHNIMIKGHEVELYFQDSQEEHQSAGIWSILDDNWVVEPDKQEVDLNLELIEKKAESIVKSIEHAEELYEAGNSKDAFEYSSKLKKKIANMRSSGLSEDGIYSPENLAFKMLRNSKYLERLSNLKINSYDKMMSLTEMYIKDYFNNKKDDDFMEFGDGGGIDALMDETIPAPWDRSKKSEL